MLTAVLVVLVAAGGGFDFRPAPVALQADTSVPPIPTAPIQFTFDTTRLLADSDSSLYQRDVLIIGFKDGTSGSSIRAFLSQFNAVIIGGMQAARGYVIQIPDPVSKVAYDSIYALMRRNSHKEFVLPFFYRYNAQPAFYLDRGAAVDPRPSMLQPDTSRPAIPNGFIYPADSSRLVEGQGRSPHVYYRNLIEVRFDDSTSGATVRSIFSKYQATIIGGSPTRRLYALRIPDPGNAQSWRALIDAVWSEPGVDLVLPVFFRASLDFVWPDGAPDTAAAAKPEMHQGFYDRSDSSRVIRGSGRNPHVYFRDLLEVVFDDSVRIEGVRERLQRYQAAIVGRGPQQSYIIHVPDPITRVRWDSLRTGLGRESGVMMVLPVLFRAAPGVVSP